MEKFSILDLDIIEDNKISIKFNGPYRYQYNRYHIIIAKKDDSNNADTFSDLCYVAKLMIDNDDSIIVKTIYSSSEELVVAEIDISKFEASENDIFVIGIIDECLFTSAKIKYSNPIEFTPRKLNAIKIKTGEKFDLDDDKMLYKFEYKNNNIFEEQTLYFSINSYGEFTIIFYYPELDKIQTEFHDRSDKCITFPLTTQGVYYIEFYGSLKKSWENSFSIFISGEILDTIDLKKSYYYKQIKAELDRMLNPYLIKVNNLTDDRYVYFSFDLEAYSEYYPDSFYNPFTICNDDTGNCTKDTEDIVIYKFLKNNNYTIYINFTCEMRGYGDTIYYFPRYYFFPIFDDIVQLKDKGFYIFSDPRIYIINFKNFEKFYVIFNNKRKVFESFIENEFSIEYLKDYSLEEVRYFTFYDEITCQYSGYKYLVLLIMPDLGDNPTQLIIANENLYIAESGDITIPAGKNYLINFELTSEEEDYYDVNPLTLLNTIVTISSPIKNMLLFTGSKNLERKDFIIQSYLDYPIYIDELDEDVTLSIKKYKQKFGYFGVLNFELFKLYLQEVESRTDGELLKIFDLSQLQIRINSDYIPISECFNFYFFNMNENINLYIKQYYGSSELNEYDTNAINLYDLSNLTKPIRNSQNLKSAFNKMINFKTDRFLTGYLSTNSYFDIYFEYDDNSTNIDISASMEEVNLKNAGKYLKKNKEYNLNFIADHLVKLEYGNGATVSIYDGNKIIATLNQENPTSIIKGSNLKIKSDKNALVLFYGKNIMLQKEIDPNQVGKNVEIEVDSYLMYIIDFGFEGYGPIEIMSFTINSFEDRGAIYLENIYDKLKVKLLENEKLYLYYVSDRSVTIKYVPNLNHKNNDYTFIYIPKKASDKSLVINNLNKEKIRYQVNFCAATHTIQMYYKAPESTEEELLEFNDSMRVIDYNISNHPHKLRFNSEEDFVFSYSFIDSIDSIFNENQKWNNERKELTNLNIEEITKKYPNDTTSNIFTIKFRANYINSSARYIIVIGSNNINNTLENFNNPCYITKLANEKPKGIITINIIDVGENDIVEEDINIREVLGETDSYILNIISQELRFEKKINYYNSTIFTYRARQESDDKEDEKEEEEEYDAEEEMEEEEEEKKEEEKEEAEEEKEEEQKEEEQKEEKEEEQKEEAEEEKEEEEKEEAEEEKEEEQKEDAEEEKEEEQKEDDAEEEMEEESRNNDGDGENNKPKKNNNTSVYIICFSIAGFIIIILVLFIIIKQYRKNKQKNDLKNQTKAIDNERLLEDI